MKLLAPFMIPFLLLALIPILIHLLTRRRFRTVTWAAMEFVLATLRRSQRRLQLRDLILMLLRTAALVCLALAAARPSLTSGFAARLGGRTEAAAVIVLDNSMSMKHRSPSGSRFELAQRLAAAAVEALPTGSAAALLLASDAIVEAVPEPSHDLAFVTDQIRKAPVSDGGSEIVPAIQRAWDLLKAQNASEREIYLVTDMQAAGWPQPDSPPLQRLIGDLNSGQPRPRLYVIHAGDAGGCNLALQNVRCADELLVRGERTTIQADLRVYGTPPDGGLMVECYADALDGTAKRKIGSVVIDKPQDRAPIRFALLPDGPQRIELQLTADAMIADNTARMVLDMVDRIRVLIVDGGDSAENQPSRRESDFLFAALAARRGADDSPFRCTVVNRFELSGCPLDDYDAVILANVAELPGDSAAKLIRFVRTEGRGLVIFAGDKAMPEAYNGLIGPDLMPARLGLPVDPPEGKDALAFSSEDLHHPVVRFFADPEARAFLTAPRFQHARRLEIVKPSESSGSGDQVQAFLWFDGRTPAMAERRAGRGAVLLAAFDAARTWSDLPLRPAFLMLVRRAVQHVSAPDRSKLTLQVNEPFLATVPLSRGDAPVLVHTPWDETERILPETVPGRDYRLVRYGNTRAAGFYRIELPDAVRQAKCFAVNPVPAESDLAALTLQDLTTRCPGLPFEWIDPSGDISRLIRRARTGTEIWLQLVLLAALCLVSEQVLAARWAPKES